MPPPDSITFSGARSPVSASFPCRPVTYRRISGITYALAAAVQARSYSRISGATMVETVRGKRGMRLGQNLPCATLVHGVCVAVDEADRDGLDAHAHQCPRGVAQLRLVQRTQHVAVGVDSFVHREAPVARRQRLGLLQEQVVEVVAHLGADLQHVAKSAGRDQSDPGSVALDDGVGDQGGAVHDAVDSGELDPRLAGDALHALADRDSGVGRAGELLAGEDHVPLFVDQHEVGERAADVHADTPALALAHRPAAQPSYP